MIRRTLATAVLAAATAIGALSVDRVAADELANRAPAAAVAPAKAKAKPLDAYLKDPSQMYKDGVERIAESDTVPVHVVSYDPATKETNYRSILAGIQEKGAVLLIYGSGDSDGVSRNTAAVARGIGERHNLAVILYDESLPSFWSDFAGLVPEGEKVKVPSLVICGRYDPMTQTEEQAATPRPLDVIGAGPDDPKHVMAWVAYTDKWVASNVTKPDGKTVTRFNNTGSGKDYSVATGAVTMKSR